MCKSTLKNFDRFRISKDVLESIGEVLAHAFPPGEGLGGDVHFDDDERWDIRPIPQVSTGANFPWVVLHEIGHAVGLGHSLNSSSIMWPIEEEFSGPLRLTEDDIEGVQVVLSYFFGGRK